MTQYHVVGKFLEAALHIILYLRGIYPDSIFEPRKIFGCTIYMSKSEAVNEYIGNIIMSLEKLLKEGQVKTFAVTILRQEKGKMTFDPIEKFVFEMVLPVNLELPESEAEQVFRQFIRKLNISESLLDEMDPESRYTFCVAVELADSAPAHLQNPPESFPWVSSAEQPEETNNENVSSKVHFLRKITRSDFSLNMFVTTTTTTSSNSNQR